MVDSEVESISSFGEACEAAEDPAALWDLALRFFRARGVQMMSYHYYGGGSEGRSRPLIRADGFPEDWVQHYVEDRLYLVDPIPELAARSTEPFFWGDVGKLTKLLDVEEDYLRELREANLGAGLGVPVFGPHWRDGYVGLGFGGERPALSAAALREMQCAAQMGHLTFCKLSSEQQGKSVGLSPREREVLFWIARGKSNAAIGQIIDISPHTVDTHVRRIYEKLGVADRTTAAIKGLGSGLLMNAG